MNKRAPGLLLQLREVFPQLVALETHHCTEDEFVSCETCNGFRAVQSRYRQLSQLYVDALMRENPEVMRKNPELPERRN